jgi:hypothetical protein
MNYSPNDRPSPLAAFFGQPTPRLYSRGVQVLRTWHWRILIMAARNGFMLVSLNKS